MKAFAIYDKKSELFHDRMFFDVSAPAAVRNVQVTVNDGKSSMSLYSDDFSLFEIGIWVPESLECPFIPHQVPILIKECSELVQNDRAEA